MERSSEVDEPLFLTIYVRLVVVTAPLGASGGGVERFEPPGGKNAILGHFWMIFGPFWSHLGPF